MIPLIGGIPNIEPLQLAVAALPGYRQALDLATEADQWLRNQPALPEVDPALRAHVTDDWVDAERARETALAEYEARRKIVQTRLHQEANRAQSIFNIGADLILGALQNDLTGLLADAEQLVAELGGATTPAEAITKDVGAAWRQLTEVADDYQDLRAAQSFVLLRASTQLWKNCTPALSGEDHANEAFIRTLDAIWPNWRQHGLKMETIDLSSRGTPARDEPWPADRGPELLVWLVTSDAEAWCPTTRQLREMWAERDAPPTPPQQPDDEESSIHDSLLWGPQEAERKRQAAGGKPRAPRRPDYTRVAPLIANRTTPPQPAELGVTQ
jgi:hypothetical protein